MNAPADLDVPVLVENDRVHRDLYLSASLFERERRTLFANAWIYVAHASQLREPGDYVTVEVAGEPLIAVRDAAGTIQVLRNRCAHKGAKLVNDRAGNVGRAFRCPYHSWAYRLDGSLLAMPLPKAYDDTAVLRTEAGRGLSAVASAEYRGFIFARVAAHGPTFDDYFGPVLSAIDAMVDRSPQGELEVAGPPLRNVIGCNWKVYLENINDSLHAPVTHDSAAQAASTVWGDPPPDTPKPMAMEQLLPFTNGYEFMAKMGSRVFANGHSILGTALSLHTSYSALHDYEAVMVAAYGKERAHEILAWTPQNAVLYPSIAIKGSPQTMRVLRPLAVDRTLIETWAFRPKGAPDILVERTQLYNRLVFSPMSIVAHDDVKVFESVQSALAASGNPWVSLHRGFKREEIGRDGYDSDGLDEVLMRNQYRAWTQLVAARTPA